MAPLLANLNPHGRLTPPAILVRPVNWIEREWRSGGKVERETVLGITSLPRTLADPEDLLKLAREHWGATENGLHWVRDEVLGEDRRTIFRGHAPQNLAALRNAALNWLRAGGIDKISAALRSIARDPLRLFTRLVYRNQAKALRLRRLTHDRRGIPSGTKNRQPIAAICFTAAAPIANH